MWQQEVGRQLWEQDSLPRRTFIPEELASQMEIPGRPLITKSARTRVKVQSLTSSSAEFPPIPSSLETGFILLWIRLRPQKVQQLQTIGGQPGHPAGGTLLAALGGEDGSCTHFLCSWGKGLGSVYESGTGQRISTAHRAQEWVSLLLGKEATLSRGLMGSS